MASEITGWLKRIWAQNNGTSGESSIFTNNTQTTQVVDSSGVQILTSGDQKTQLADQDGNSILPTGRPRRITGSLTRPANTTTYDANDNIGAYTIQVKQKDTVTLTGTTGSVNISVPNIANRTIAFDADLTTTAAAFITDYAADFLPLVVVTSSGADVIFEAATAGVPFEHPIVTNTAGDLDGTIVNTTDNATFSPVVFQSCARVNGGGGFISDITIVTDSVEFAGKTVKLALFNESPSGIVGDGVAYVDTFANSLVYQTEFTVEIGRALGTGAVKGTISPIYEFLTEDNDSDLYGLLYVTSSVTTPKSAAVFHIHLDVIQL